MSATRVASPYRGLTHFTEDDSALFFGRDREREVILANLKGRRVTLLYGESGVGKSSLLRAGVVHDLRELARRDAEDPDLGHPEYVPVIAASWSGDPLGTVLGALGEAVAPFVRGSFRPPTSSRLDAAIDDLAAQADARLLVIFDQLEEYFLYHQDEAGDGTLATELARALLRPHLRASFLLSIREDALAKLDRFKRDVPALFDTVLRIGPLDRVAAREAIVEPLRAFAGTGPRGAEPELVEAILDEVSAGRLVLEGSGQGRVERDGAGSAGRPIEAPYLQVVLTRLWEEEDDPDVLRLATLERLGGAEAIVRAHLDGALDTLPAEKRAVAADALRYLVTPSGTKIALSAGDLASFTGRDDVAPLLEQLSGSRVRILRAVSAPGGQGGPPRYEIFHDVLGAAVLDWRSRYVREQERLELERRAVAERERLEQEKREAEQREQVERRRARTFRTVAAAAIGLLIAACAFLAYALVQKSHAEHEQHVSKSQALAAETRNALGDGRLATAVPLALAAYEGSRGTTAAQDALLAAVEQSNGLRRLLRYGEAVEGTALDPGGGTVAAATGQTLVLRRTNGQRVARAVEPAGVSGVAFSSDGALLAAARDDGAVALFRVRRDAHGEIAGLQRPRVLEAGAAAAKAVAFSADGGWLAAGTGDGVVVWPLRGLAAGAPTLLRPGGDFARSVAFCPARDGRGPAVAAAFADGRVVLWPTPAGDARASVVEPAGPQAAGAVACSGATLAAGGDDEVVTLFRLGPGGSATRLTRLSGHSDGIEALAFSSDGRVLVSGADDHSAILWDVQRDRPLGPPLRAHTQPVVAVGFDRSGSTLAVGSEDGRVSIWDAAAVEHAGAGIEVTRDRVRDAALDNAVFVAVTSKDDVLVRRARRLDPAGRLPGVPPFRVHATRVAVDPGGRWIALGLEDSVRLFRLGGGTPTELALTGRRGVDLVAVARDGTLAAALPGGAIRVWRGPHGSRESPDLRAPGRPGSASALAAAPDGSAVSAAYGDRVALWRKGASPTVLDGNGGGVGDLAFGGGGKLAAAGDKAIDVWDVENGHLLATLPAGAEAVAFSPDGRWLASSGPDGTVRVWDVDAHRQLGEPLPTPAHEPVAALAFTGASSLAAVYRDGTAAEWDLSRWRIRTRLDSIEQSLRRAVGSG